MFQTPHFGRVKNERTKLCSCRLFPSLVFTLSKSIFKYLMISLSLQLAIEKPISIKDSSTLMQVDQNETNVVVKDEMQNGGSSQAETIIYHSKVVTIIV